MNLESLQTPALLLDLDLFEAHCQAMKDKCKALNVALRPHLKTGKSWEFARRQMTSLSGPATVSTLKEAEYFFSKGVTDMIYAVGISPGKLDRVTELRKAGCGLSVILDSVECADMLSRYSEEHKVSMPALIEIDCDGHRSGVEPDSDELLEIAEHLTGQAYLAGVLTHAGESYACRGAQQCRAAQENERDSLIRAAVRLRSAGYECKIVSAGSTPTAFFALDWTGVTEVRCGVYCTMDLVMAGIGVCKPTDIALSVITEVIGAQKKKGWILCDAGWMALSRDRGTASQAVDMGYGMVCDIEGRPIGDLIVSAASQEHGIITSRSGEPIDFERFAPGTRLRILPNHACPTAAQYTEYIVVQGTQIVDCWNRIGGWQPKSEAL